jgi:hypothetical protein
MIGLWLNRDPRIVYDGVGLKHDFLAAYVTQSHACMITYLSNAKYPVGLTFGDISRRLFSMGFDPYNCGELRWGDEGGSCPDQADKRHWYESEEQARHVPVAWRVRRMWAFAA